MVGGIITLRACGITINFKVCELLKPRDFDASFWPLLMAKIPALTFSAMNADVYNDKENNRAKNSGTSLTPPK